MFLHLSVSHSVQGVYPSYVMGRGCTSLDGHPPRQTPTQCAETPRADPLGRHPQGRHSHPEMAINQAVRILLECIHCSTNINPYSKKLSVYLASLIR